MPKTFLSRRDIIIKYLGAIHPVGDSVPNLPKGLEESASNPTFGVSFHTEADVESGGLPSDASAAAEATNSILPAGSLITPMLHQESTAKEIFENLHRGVTTVVLGDPLGAGKTHEAIMAYLHLRQVNPDLGMVITVPDVVIPDWLDALASVGIAASDCQTILSPKNIQGVDMHHLPTVLFVKQSLTLNRSSEAHQMALEKLKAIYAIPRVHVFDEKTSASPTILALYNSAKQNPRFILSGTVVTNSVQDLSYQFEDAEQLGAPGMKGMMAESSQFFCQYFGSTFFGTHPLTPGNVLLNFLSLSTFMHTSLYSRMPSCLPIRLPKSQEEFLCIDSEGMASQGAVSKTREEPTILLSGVGASVTVDADFNHVFFTSHSSFWYDSKLKRLIAECSIPNPSAEPTDMFVVTASQSTSRQLVKDLALPIVPLKYTCIFIHEKLREAKIKAAREAGLSIIFVTESNRVEGFNIQKHLAKIIFFDAVRDAGDYAQAVGRGVRRGNQSSLVDIKQYCTSHIADYVEKRITTTRKAKTLLELIHADPAAIFLLLTQDVLTRHQGRLRKGVDFGLISSSMHSVLDVLCKNLQQICQGDDSHQIVMDFIGLLTCAKPSQFELSKWRLEYKATRSRMSEPLIHLFLFEKDILRFAFDNASAKQFEYIQQAIAICKSHFLRSIASLTDLATLLQPQYLNLAYGFNLAADYLLVLQRLLEQRLKVEPLLSGAEAFHTLKIVYSSIPGVFPERSAIQAILLNYLKDKGFFTQLSFEQWVQAPFLLFAFVDANLDPIMSEKQLMVWLTPVLMSNPQQAYQILCQLSAYPSQHTQALLDRILPRLYHELEQRADHAPGVVYLHECNDVLAEHMGKLAPWTQRLLTFVKTLAPDAPDRGEILARCKKWIKECSKSDQCVLLAAYGELLNESKLARCDEQPGDGQMEKRAKTLPLPLPLPLPLHSQSFFCSQKEPLQRSAPAAACPITIQGAIVGLPTVASASMGFFGQGQALVAAPTLPPPCGNAASSDASEGFDESFLSYTLGLDLTEEYLNELFGVSFQPSASTLPL